MDDNTCRASAQFGRFVENLRTQKRAKTARLALKEEFTGVTLHDWQNEAVLNLDECVLAWHPGPFGSSFQEFGMFNTHSFP